MVSKRKLKKKVWRCQHGCPIEKTGIPCKHLERLITKTNKEPMFESVNERVKLPSDYYSSGAGYIIPEGIRNKTFEKKFITGLSKTELSELQIDILVLTYIYSYKVSEIAEELNIPSLSTVIRIRSESLQYLKRINYGKRNNKAD